MEDVFHQIKWSVFRHIGCILASKSPYSLDLVASEIIGLSPDSVPTIGAAISRGLSAATAGELSVYGDPTKYHVSDYQNIAVKRSLLFKGNSDNVLKNMFGAIAKKALDSKPVLKGKLCIGCNKCGRICPAKAIVIENGKAVIDREKCIRCFCCQEFCPVGAMQVKRTLVARLMQRNKTQKTRNKTRQK